MAFLNQTNFPGLWNLAQYFIGGTVDKRRLCLAKYNGERDVLEVGCSVGNTSRAFVKFPNIRFTGLDVDASAIRYARRSFHNYENFKFITGSLADLTKSGQVFDYILFAGLCHHVSDPSMKEMLAQSSALLRKGGRIVVVDPVLPEPGDPKFYSLFLKLEQGAHVRPGAQLESLLKSEPTLSLVEAEYFRVSSTPLAMPKCARFGLYLLTAAETS